MNSVACACLASLFFALASFAARAAEPLRVIYPRSESARDVRAAYPLAVLRNALDLSGVPYALSRSALEMQQSRSLRELVDGTRLDVVWSVTTAEREAKLRPVRIPIDRGLIGWRLLLIRQGDAPRYAGIAGVTGLAPLRGAQGHDWPDLEVLRASGLAVEPSATYEGLFAMLGRGRVDYVPRAVHEVAAELVAHAELPLQLEPSLLVHYPSALYFFVHPGNDALALALERGLELSVANGSLLRLFEQHYGALIAAGRLGLRTRIELANPTLPAATPLDRRELWFEPGATP